MPYATNAVWSVFTGESAFPRGSDMQMTIHIYPSSSMSRGKKYHAVDGMTVSIPIEPVATHLLPKCLPVYAEVLGRARYLSVEPIEGGGDFPKFHPG